MSTRSVIAIDHPDRPGWAGRYVHSSGQPLCMVPVLRSLVRRDGLDATIRTVVTDSAGWSALCPTQPDFTTARIAHNAKWDTYPSGSVKQQAVDFRQVYGDAKRFRNVPGMGVAYRPAQNAGRLFDDRTGADSDVAFAYVLSAEGIRCFSNGGMEAGAEWLFRGTFGWETAADDDARLVAAECGENFEDCCHTAVTHFPDETGIDGSIGTRYHLGYEESDLTFGYAAAVVLPDGTHAALQGSFGHYASRAGKRGTLGAGPRPWFLAAVRAADGTCPDVLVGKRTARNGLVLDLPVVFPANRVRGERVVPAGASLR